MDNTPSKPGESNPHPRYTHVALGQFLAKVLKLERPPAPESFRLFNLHSPNTNYLRWLSLQLKTNDLFLSELIAKERSLCILPSEKLMILPKAVELYNFQADDNSARRFKRHFDDLHQGPIHPEPHAITALPKTLLRQILDVAPTREGPAAKVFHHQTLRDNVALVDAALLHQINALVAAAGQP